MAELFFQDMDPLFISRPTANDLGYDLLVGFSNDRAGINMFAVEVKGAERPPRKAFRLFRSTFDRIAHSNIPGLIVVADVKQNRLYYAWLRPEDAKEGSDTASVQLIEVNPATKRQLENQLKHYDGRVAVAG